eukprot:TRINITY_DN2401_c3_g1_i1.p1 TRINITY_DN2401_c3_g1~~TRINITY_DN2401_c3_g1_i1.p1  ORF type:complete len:633 (-),score=164.54 TRINITY_DN2401_c3_g1_i1:46-1767(-)
MLEEQFLQCYHEMCNRLLPGGDSPTRLQHSGGLHTSGSSLGGSAGGGVEDDREFLRAHVLRKFATQCIRDVGSDDVNLMVVWHGAEERWQFSNACSGMRKMPPLSADEAAELSTGRSRRDFGYYGRGVYFTQYPSCGMGYIMRPVVMRRAEGVHGTSTSDPRDDDGGEGTMSALSDNALQVTATARERRPWADKRRAEQHQGDREAAAAAKKKEEEEEGEGEGEEEEGSKREDCALDIYTKPLLMCYAVLGRVYPVTESTTLPFHENLHGKECVAGYDSHYVLTAGQDAEMQPVRVLRDAKGQRMVEAEKADEIVVFSPAQVLPRAVVYLSEKGALRRPSMQKPVVVWVDPRRKMTDVQRCAQFVEANASSEILHAATTAELVTFLQRYRNELRPLLERRHIRIITNRYRAGDGGDKAAARLIQRVKRVMRPGRTGLHIPILVYCGRMMGAMSLWNPKEEVYVTTNDKVAQAFAAMDPINERWMLHAMQVVLQRSHRLLRREHLVEKKTRRVCQHKGCSTPFGVFHWRYHCNWCGELFCSEHALLMRERYPFLNLGKRCELRLCFECMDEAPR